MECRFEGVLSLFVLLLHPLLFFFLPLFLPSDDNSLGKTLVPFNFIEKFHLSVLLNLPFLSVGHVR